MIHAYQEIFLNSAMNNLGDAFDYAINDCGMEGQQFVDIFINSTVCRKIEKGEYKYLIGKSGIEIAIEAVEEITGETISARSRIDYGRTPEFWCGWALAYYQWYSGKSYSEIFHVVSFSQILSLYPTLHEADVSKFAQVIDNYIDRCIPDTNLKVLRQACGYSQSQLSNKANVSLRSIQMYEQRHKDINKASVTTVRQLAQALGCSMEKLLEKQIQIK